MGSISYTNPVIDSTGVVVFPSEASTIDYAEWLDSQDPLRGLRDEFIIPSKTDLKRGWLAKNDNDSEKAISLSANALGLQPRATSRYIEAYLNTWSTIGGQGHYRQLDGSPLKPWMDLAEFASEQSSRLVGAQTTEVTVMNSLTTNLHLMMASFYKPTAKKFKIILEWKAFPSDHYVIESQIAFHGFDPREAMIMIQPDEDEEISTSKILKVISENASETALVLLPGVQYYSGQLFDISTITSHAHSHDLLIGWDLAHAAGNVPLRLHDWNVDFATWCNYKYLCAGPGAIGGVFIHERHGKVNIGQGQESFMPRLTGWYGSDPKSRFTTSNRYVPIPGAAGWQLSNPSAVDISSLCAALSVFNQTSMTALRGKSVLLTGYLEYLVQQLQKWSSTESMIHLITPSIPAERGAQLSLLIQKEELLDQLVNIMKQRAIVVDVRRPNLVRVAPSSLYSTFMDVWQFAEALRDAISACQG